MFMLAQAAINIVQSENTKRTKFVLKLAIVSCQQIQKVKMFFELQKFLSSQRIQKDKMKST